MVLEVSCGDVLLGRLPTFGLGGTQAVLPPFQCKPRYPGRQRGTRFKAVGFRFVNEIQVIETTAALPLRYFDAFDATESQPLVVFLHGTRKMRPIFCTKPSLVMVDAKSCPCSCLLATSVPLRLSHNDAMKRARSRSRDRARSPRRHSDRQSSRDRHSTLGRRKSRSRDRETEAGPGWELRYLADGSTFRAPIEKRPERSNRGAEKVTRTEEGSLGALWPSSVDRALFDSNFGTSKVKRGTAEYFDFKDFYKKFKDVEARKGNEKERRKFKSREEADRAALEDVEKALRLFETFTEKQKTETRKNMLAFRQNLPIYPLKDQILGNLAGDNDVLLVAGDTGCGKSTQVPQFLLDSDLQRICVTQPRRIACVSLARRVAEERGEERGSEVGYAVRFANSASIHTRLVFATEGVVVRQLASDPLLEKFDAVVVDEVHERHLQADLLVAVLRRIVVKRRQLNKPLQVILMSATMDLELWSGYLGCPVVSVPGRLHPVLVHHRPLPQPDRNLVDPALVAARRESGASAPVQSNIFDPAPFLRTLGEIESRVPWNERGDVLVFLPGVQEIEKLQIAATEWSTLRTRDLNSSAPQHSETPWLIHPLHSTLPLAAQNLVFQPTPPGRRKMILSTNIAETSLTLPEIRFVIDSGRVRELDYLGGVGRLRTYWISLASARQRAGRAGRTGPGEAWRLWSEAEEAGMNAFAGAEINRVPMEGIALQVLSLGLDPRSVGFIEPPSPERIEAGMRRLRGLGAVTGPLAQEKLTPLGAVLARLPLDPGIGRMLVLTTLLAPHLLEPILTISGALSVQSPFLRGSSRSFDHQLGDLPTLLRLYGDWLSAKSRNDRGWASRMGVEEQRMYEIGRVRSQVAGILEDAGDDQDDPEEGGEEKKGRRKKIAWMAQEDEDWEERKKRRRQREVLERRRRMLDVGEKEGRRDPTAEQVEGEQGSLPWIHMFRCEEPHSLTSILTDISKMSIHDLEFALRYSSPAHLASHAESASIANLTSTDLDLIKFLACAGMFPNFAIPDPGNPQRKDADQIFHTRNKKMVYAHPASVFAIHTDWIHPVDADTGLAPAGELGTLDSLHRKRHAAELLCYQSLLETSGKPYLVNSIKVPSVHVLLLFGTLDVSADLARMVVDDWLDVRFHDKKTAQRALVLACWLRSAMEVVTVDGLKGFVERLPGKDHVAVPDPEVSHSTSVEDSINSMLPVIERIHSYRLELLSPHADKDDPTVTPDELSSTLTEFLSLQFPRTLVQLAKQSELQSIFPLYSFAESTGSKPGIEVTPFLRWNAIPSVAAEYPMPPVHMAQFWKCGHCGFAGVVTRAEAKEHLGGCEGYNGVVKVPKRSERKVEEKMESEVVEEELKGGRNWLCGACGTVLSSGTPVAILKHKRICVGRSTDAEPV